MAIGETVGWVKQGVVIALCLPTYTEEKEAADKRAAKLKAQNEVERAANHNARMRQVFTKGVRA